MRDFALFIGNWLLLLPGSFTLRWTMQNFVALFTVEIDGLDKISATKTRRCHLAMTLARAITVAFSLALIACPHEICVNLHRNTLHECQRIFYRVPNLQINNIWLLAELSCRPLFIVALGTRKRYPIARCKFVGFSVESRKSWAAGEGMIGREIHVLCIADWLS
jgi:hypothetical protein